MKAEMEGKMQYGIGGLICGAVVAIVIGFAWGGWSTAGATQEAAERAVLKSQVAICVAQFVKEPKSNEILKEFEGIESYNRSDFVEKGGWDKMPGQTESRYAVSSACSDGIEALITK